MKQEQKINLIDTEKIPLESPGFVETFGKTLIVAPHPDDESLGCGGAIALLRKLKREVAILVLSDGTLSHPNSRKYPKEKLRGLRENELKIAAEILGVKDKNITFFRYTDRAVPHDNSPDFLAAVERCRDYLAAEKPQTIFVPWRRDPHPDHCAAFQLLNAAKNDHHQIIEYPIWLYELASSDAAPRTSEVSAFRLDIAAVVALKQRAIRAHLSQITDLIDDDAEGFRLSEEVLAKFAQPFEIYLRPVN